MTRHINLNKKCIVLDRPTKAFLSTLRERRRSRALTLYDIANMLNVRAENISRYERCKQIPSLNLLLRLAEIFNYDISESLNYKFYCGEIDIKRVRERFIKHGFNYSEMSRLIGYSQRLVKSTLFMEDTASVAVLAAILEVLDAEDQSSQFRSWILKKGRKT